jgi:hypothetical protein
MSRDAQLNWFSISMKLIFRTEKIAKRGKSLRQRRDAVIRGEMWRDDRSWNISNEKGPISSTTLKCMTGNNHRTLCETRNLHESERIQLNSIEVIDGKEVWRFRATPESV